VHCTTKHQAEAVLDGIIARMKEVGLRLHPEKTRIVYCKDDNRRGHHEHTSFAFLGFAFRPREAVNRGSGAHFTSFSPAISPEALKAKSTRLRGLRIHRRNDLSLDDLARWLNPIVAGWMNYYGRVLPGGVVSPPAARQLLPETLGWEEVQTATDLQAVQAVVGRATRKRTRPVRPLAVGPLALSGR
jgi:hypothetical protein